MNTLIVKSKVLLFFLVIFTVYKTAAQTTLLKNINPETSQIMSGLASVENTFIEFNGALYFAADDGSHGVELWKTNGTAAGTVMVKNINPETSQIMNGLADVENEFTVFNNELYFAANDGVHGFELWKTNGTSSGTIMVKNINPETSQIMNGLADVENVFTIFNNELYFAADDGTHGVELWKTNGTGTGTVIVKNIHPETIQNSSSLPNVQNTFTVFNNALYFAADDGTHGVELWKTNGTGAGTVMVKNIHPETTQNSSSLPDVENAFTIFNSELYFAADDGVHGFELWKTNGTSSGTIMVKNINPETSQIMNGLADVENAFIILNNELYFAADDGTHGTELWKTNGTGTGTVMVKNIHPETIQNSSSLPKVENTFIIFNNELYFAADDGTHGVELWKTNGTDLGTTMIKNIRPETTQNSSSLPDVENAFIVYQCYLYFAADDGAHGFELWKTNGTEIGTSIVENIHPETSQNSSGLSNVENTFTIFNNELYFAADDGTHGFELWTSKANLSPTILTNPTSQSICAGGNTNFIATASGGVSYQWQISCDNGISWSDLNNSNLYGGVTTNNLEIHGGLISINGCSFRLKVTGGDCITSVFSNSATLTVNAYPTVTFNNNLGTVCITDQPFNLIGGTPAGGTYSGLGVSSNIFTPSSAGLGQKTISYTYTLNGCTSGATNSIIVGSQSIQTASISNDAYCPGSSISVPFTVSCVFYSGNTFTLLLSDEFGNFSPTSYNLGSLTQINSGTINGTIPSGIVLGNNYKIRVIGSSPLVIGTSSNVSIASCIGGRSSQITISPNPASNRVIINLPTTDQTSTIRFSDLKGKEIKQFQTSSNEYEIPIKDIPNGLYLLHILTNNKWTVHKVEIIN